MLRKIKNYVTDKDIYSLNITLTGASCVRTLIELRVIYLKSFIKVKGIKDKG